jgi:hypothetical protein
MTMNPAHEMLCAMPVAQRAEILRWMNAYDIHEDNLTLPLLRLLAAAAGVDDEGAKRVVAALLEQELPGRQAARA